MALIATPIANKGRSGLRLVSVPVPKRDPMKVPIQPNTAVMASVTAVIKSVPVSASILIFLSPFILFANALFPDKRANYTIN